MSDLNEILKALQNALPIALVALMGYVIYLLRTASTKFTETTAEELAKAISQQVNWRAELDRVLQKTRGVERQELRYKSYGALWKELGPLAIYDDSEIDRATVGELFSKLSNWYFSECGGLLLTPQAREFYFALQDLLRTTSKFPAEWHVDRSEASHEDQKPVFRKVLAARSAGEAVEAFDYFLTGEFENWQDKGSQLGKDWKKGIEGVAKAWSELDERQRFATLQQVGSILRTSLVYDLESRLR